MSSNAVTWQRYLPNGITLGFVEFYERGRLYKTEYYKKDRSLPMAKQEVVAISSAEFLKS